MALLDTRIKPVKFKDIVNPNDSDRTIYMMDYLSQPDQTLINRVPGITRKSGRILPMADEKDIVFLNQNRDMPYFEWMRSVGMGTDNIFEFNAPIGVPLTELMLQNVDEVKRFLSQFDGNKVMVPVYSGRLEKRVAEAIDITLFGNSGEITDKFYHKGSFKKIAKSLGIPVPEGECINETDPSKIRSIIMKYLETTGEAMVKATSSASGNFIYSVNEDNMGQIVDSIKGGGEHVVEVKHPFDIDINDQWIIDLKGNIHFLGDSSEYLVNGGYAGNDYPVKGVPQEEMWKYSRIIAEHMRDEGYVGVFGLDVLYGPDGFLFIENNSRMNGSTYARGIVDKISQSTPADIWIARNMRSRIPMTFDQLMDLTEDLMFDGTRKGTCYFPFNTGLLSETGEYAGVFVGNDEKEVQKIYEEVSFRT